MDRGMTAHALAVHEWVEENYATPHWVKFEYKNVNPKGRHTGDCSTRAIAELLQIPYADAIMLQCKDSIEKGYGLINKETVGHIVEKEGWVKQKQPRKGDNTKYHIGEIYRLVSDTAMKNGVLILLANHWTVVRDFKLLDLWDCRFKTISNYWIKE